MPKTEIIKLDGKTPTADYIKQIKKAARILKKGGLVAFPTETVYGVGADLKNPEAINRLYEIKNRPKDKPFTVAIADLTQLTELGCKVSPYAFRFIDHFWPGPLTLILWTGYEKKLGIRMPDERIALALLREVNTPVALPSANISGSPAPTTSDEVLKDLAGKVEIILDGGRTKIGTASTVLDLTAFPYRILREGAIKNTELERIPRKSILFVCTGNSCRSIMAEGFFKKMLKEKPKGNIEVRSAGIVSMDGFSPTEETIQVMKEEDVNVSKFKSSLLTSNLLNRADLILVMQEMHKNEILKRMPQAKGKVHLLREFTRDETGKDDFDLAIPDPISKPIESYRRVAQLIKRNIEKLTEMI